jgi:hypothetical protein
MSNQSVTIAVQLPWREEFTEVSAQGDYADAVMNVCIGALSNVHTVYVKEEDGTYTPLEDYVWDQD